MSATEDHNKAQAYQYQAIDQAVNITNKKRIIDIMQGMVNASPAELNDAISTGYHTDASVNVTHPINELSSPGTVAEKLWKPLRHAIPDVERRDDIVLGGVYRGTNWIGCLGHYIGTFENDWMDIPATRGIVSVRYAEGHELRDGKIVKSYLFIDFLDLMRQAGYWPIAPSLGCEMRWLAPHTHDGVILTPQDNETSRRTIERILRMHNALGQYNGQPPTRIVLDQMEMVKHWHPNFMWMGPSGIGSTRGLKGFEDYHQIPFLLAFPDRAGSDLGHFIRVGDGSYAVSGGWGYLQATHTGNQFLGLPATGKRIKFRVMDFYRCDENTIVENWIPWDVPHTLLQMGVDVFGRMRHQFRQQGAIRSSEWLL